MSLRAAAHLYKRSLSPGERLQMAVIYLGDRRACARLAGGVARVALDYLHDGREGLERAIEVALHWASSQADAEGLAAARHGAAELGARVAADDDRCAWTCIQTSLALADVALEPMPDLAAKRARDLAGYVLDAMCWPDVTDGSLRADAAARLHDALDALFDATHGPSIVPYRFTRG